MISIQKDIEPLKDGDMIYQKDGTTFPLIKWYKFWDQYTYILIKYTWHWAAVYNCAKPSSLYKNPIYNILKYPINFAHFSISTVHSISQCVTIFYVKAFYLSSGTSTWVSK